VNWTDVRQISAAKLFTKYETENRDEIRKKRCQSVTKETFLLSRFPIIHPIEHKINIYPHKLSFSNSDTTPQQDSPIQNNSNTMSSIITRNSLSKYVTERTKWISRLLLSLFLCLIISPFYRFLITLFTGAATATAFYAALSCRWFVLVDHDAAAFDFLPNDEAIQSIGLFGYLSQEDASVCIPYDPVFLGNGGSGWRLTTQLFAVFGPIVAFFALLANICDKRRWTGMLLWSAGGLQTGAMLASMSFKSGSRSFAWAPWMIGAYINALSIAFFYLSWTIVTFDFHCCCQRAGPAEKEAPAEDTGSEESLSFPSSSSDGLPREMMMMTTMSMDDEFEDIELCDDDVKEHKLTAEELLGTNDPIIFMAVAQGAMAIREFAINKKEEITMAIRDFGKKDKEEGPKDDASSTEKRTGFHDE
jgi:hypothetical protein